MANRWDERYRTGEYGDKQPEPVLIRFAKEVPAGSALDIACGLGRHSLWLAEQGWDVTAVDYSDVALTTLRERTAGLRVTALRADLEADEFTFEPSSRDLICDCCFLWRPLFKSMREALRPGGIFIGVFPITGDHNARPPINPDYLMQPGETARFFNDWEILHSFEGRPGDDPGRRLRAEIVARKPALSARG